VTQVQDMLTARRPGWLTFAAIVMFAVGILRFIAALYYFADSARINNTLRAGPFGDNLFLWGIWDLVIAVIAIWAGYSLLSGDILGKVVAYVWAVLVIVQSFMIIGWAPWYATAMLVLAGLVIYGLSLTDWYHETPAALPPRQEPPPPRSQQTQISG
jgi:hypothetical protein